MRSWSRVSPFFPPFSSNSVRMASRDSLGRFHAMSTGVSPLVFMALISAPASMRTFMPST